MEEGDEETNLRRDLNKRQQESKLKENGKENTKEKKMMTKEE